MHGRVIFINPLTSTGLIFGADRERYSFPTSEWTEPGLPRPQYGGQLQGQG